MYTHTHTPTRICSFNYTRRIPEINRSACQSQRVKTHYVSHKRKRACYISARFESLGRQSLRYLLLGLLVPTFVTGWARKLIPHFSHPVQGWMAAWCLHFNYPTFHSVPLLVFASFSRRRKERASAPTRLLRLISELLKGEGVCARAWVHVEDTNQLVIQPSHANNYSGVKVKLVLNLNQLFAIDTLSSVKQ